MSRLHPFTRSLVHSFTPFARQRGVTYLGLLLAIAFISAVLASTATVWSQTQRREREKQLLWAGGELRKALASYSRYGNGTYPRRLEDLLEDTRTRVVRRHLRHIYEDPMTRSTDWGLVRNAQGGIVGVYSRDQRAPLKTGDFRAELLGFEEARSYADWKFAATKVITKADVDAAKTPATPPAGDAQAAAPASKPATDAPPAAPAVKPAAPAPAEAKRPDAAPPAVATVAPAAPTDAKAAPAATAESKPAPAEQQQAAPAPQENAPYKPFAIPRSAVIGGAGSSASSFAPTPLTPAPATPAVTGTKPAQ